MSASQQRKGRAGELELVRILQEHGIPARPGDPVSYGQTPDVIGIDNIHPEVKRVEHLSIDAAVDQAIRDSQKFGDGMPAVFHRKNRRPWLVTMLLSDWIRLYQERDDHLLPW
jgi:Holliday junction resolvase